MPPILEAVGVHVHYGPVRALDGADLAVAEGEWVSVTGPSGSGKSTLLSLFATLDHPDTGTVRFRGRDLAGTRHLDHYRRHDIGLVFQLHNLLPHLDARGNVEIVMLGSGPRRAARRARAEHLLDLVDLGPQARRRPAELSGGERQRVAIARALANGPAVLLADEPTGNLDRESAAKVVDLFRELHREQGLSIVLVTHDPTVAAAADRVVVLEGGVVREGPPQPASSTPSGLRSSSATSSAASR